MPPRDCSTDFLPRAILYYVFCRDGVRSSEVGTVGIYGPIVQDYRPAQHGRLVVPHRRVSGHAHGAHPSSGATLEHGGYEEPPLATMRRTRSSSAIASGRVPCISSRKLPRGAQLCTRSADLPHGPLQARSRATPLTAKLSAQSAGARAGRVVTGRVVARTSDVRHDAHETEEQSERAAGRDGCPCDARYFTHTTP